MREEQNTV